MDKHLFSRMIFEKWEGGIDFKTKYMYPYHLKQKICQVYLLDLLHLYILKNEYNGVRIIFHPWRL